MATETTPKAMSTRLLTMKFMQRAAASPPASSPTTPKSEEQSSKRRKVSHIPASPTVQSLVDKAAVERALAEEERKRDEALLKHAADAGDARWVLDIQHKGANPTDRVTTPLSIVQVGFAEIDSVDADSDTEYHPVRRYNMDKKKASFSESMRNPLG
jgi:hypothetical protein